jgi:hypothetical protein
MPKAKGKDPLRKKPRKTIPGGSAHDRKVVDDYVKKVMSGLSRLECAVCGRVNGFDFYMVRDSVWKEAGLRRDASSCLDCLERKLGRGLDIQDFDMGKPMNRPLVFGYRMARGELKRAGGRAEALGKIPGLPRLPRVPKKARG